LRPGGAAEAGFAVVKSRLLRARGELRAALRVLRRACGDPGTQAQPAWLEREVALCRAQLLTAGGHPDDALAALAQLADQDRADVLIARAEAQLAAGEREQARLSLGRAVAAGDVTAPVSVNAQLAVAALAVDCGELREAQSAVREALRLADPESLQRYFHEVGAGLRRLMRDDRELVELHRSLGRRGHPAHPQALHAAGSAAGTVMVEKLSDREMDVLRHVDAMLPTEEIAGVMYLSVNTVKTHVRSILRKLAASRRNEAVRRARELGLI
jgi:LuxR family maltose regulon positive regulatory protein